MKSELSDQQKQQLQDIERFNATTGRQGWHLKNKRLEEQPLSGIELVASSMVDVDLVRVPGRDATISDSKFDKVNFVDSDFSGSRFTKVNFTGCDFSGTSFKQSQFVECTFAKCKAENVKMEEVTFKKCTFENMSDKSGIYTRARFLDCRLTGSDWLKTSLYYAHFEGSEFTSGVLEKVGFSNTTLTNLKFSDLKINASSFQESVAEHVSFDNCKSNGITFGKAEINDVSFVDCDGFNTLTITASQCRQLVIENCRGFSEAQLYLSKFSGLTIKDSRLSYLDCAESEYEAPMLIENCTISGANFLKAKVKGLTINNSSFDDYLVLSGATFENLVLRNVELADKIEIDAKDVTYINSDRFPSK